MKRNIKLFTHTDLDGIGCAILAKIAFANDNLEIEYCDYDNIDKKIMDTSLYWDTIYITDISVNEDIAKALNNAPCDVLLFDHHPTALWLNKYDWANVRTGNEERKECGTSLLSGHLDYKVNDYSDIVNINELVELIRMYDTWEWKNKYNDIQPKKLNDLFQLYGREKFANEFIQRLYTKEFVLFTEHDEELLQAEQNKIGKYIAEKSKQLIETEILGYKAGVVFAEQYVSELGNKLSEQNPHLDFIAMIDMGFRTVSYRTVSKDIDLGKDVAKIFKGGGHPQAAGSKIDDLVINEFIKNVFGGM